MKKLMVFVLACALVLSGCSHVLQSPAETTAPTNHPTGTDMLPTEPGAYDAPPVEVDFEQTDDLLFSERDDQIQYPENNFAVITLSGSSVSSNASTVQISGSTATITKEGYYILRGQLTDGSIIINASDKAKVQLILEGAAINSASNAVIYVRSADKVFLTLADGTKNALTNGGSFPTDDANNVDGAVFSKTDLTINGNGTLTVTSPAGHGIVCKDDLIITGGDITVQSAFHGLDANDSLRMKGGQLTIDSGKDGIHVEDADNSNTGFVYVSGGKIKMETEGDGISAALHMQLSGATIDVLAGGGYENGRQHTSGGWGDFMGGGMGPGGQPPRPKAATAAQTEDVTSMKGLKAGAGLLIKSGIITVNAADDAIHSDTITVLNGGKIEIASGDDGIHADTDLTITAGTVKITQSYEGLEAQNISIAGGDVSLVSSDDGMNAAGGVDGSGEGGRDQMAGGRPGPGGMGAGNGSVTISGGKLYIKSSGDGIDANGTLRITGGYTVVCCPNTGDTAVLDYDVSGTITGGVFIGTGSSMMAQSFSSGSQAVLAVNTGNQTAGSCVTVKDSQGKILLQREPELPYTVFIYSAPELVAGQSYHLVAGSNEGDIAAT